MKNYSYIGSELELFRYASNWKAYYGSLIDKYLGDEVLEVGAGIGSTTEFLCKGYQKRWLCLEPDPALSNTLDILTVGNKLPKCCEYKTAFLSDLSERELFDTIIYIDVLEHIKEDENEVNLAAKHLKEGGFLVVLSPAHQWLFTPFDRAIGHHRRYTKKSLQSIIPANLETVGLMYLDSIGLLASLGNRFILKSKMPNIKQIKLWDKGMVPLSQKVDPILKYSLGKSILGIWRKLS